MGWCSDDSFFYFRLWLVGLGRDLAWEELDHAAAQAFVQVTGRTEEAFYEAVEARGGEDPEAVEPVGEQWDANDDERAKRRLPRLSELFPADL